MLKIRGNDKIPGHLHIWYIIIQALAELLYKSASEHGYINPDKVEEILGVPRRDEDVRAKQPEALLSGKACSIFILDYLKVYSRFYGF